MSSSPPPLHQRQRGQSPTSSTLLIGLIITGLLALVIMAFELQKNTVYFLTPAEAYAQAQDLQHRTIRVGGMVELGSLQQPGSHLQHDFTVWDLKHTRIQVSYVGLLPDMFKEGSGVVIEGTISPQGQSFEAHNLMVKHSEEYVQPEHHSSINSTLLEASIFKNTTTNP